MSVQTAVSQDTTRVLFLKSIAGHGAEGLRGGFSFDSDDVAEIDSGLAKKWASSGTVQVLRNGAGAKREDPLLAAARTALAKLFEDPEYREAEQKAKASVARRDTLRARLEAIDRDLSGVLRDRGRSLNAQVGELLAGSAEAVKSRLLNPELLAVREGELRKEQQTVRSELQFVERTAAQAATESQRARAAAGRRVIERLRPQLEAAIKEYITDLLRVRDRESQLADFRRLFEREAGHAPLLPVTLFGRTQGLAGLLVDLRDSGIEYT